MHAVDKDCIFYLYDGKITGNTSVDGGAIYLNQEPSTLSMHGGEISGNTATGSGGGNICLINGNSDEQLRAGWEFINFIMQDEWVALNAIKTGYVPGTKSVAENETMKAAWAKDPNTRVAYDQLAWAYGNETPYFPERMEFVQIIAAATSLLIQEQSITPEEAFEQVQNDSAHLFN